MTLELANTPTDSSITPQMPNYGLTEARFVMNGVCFAAAEELTGSVFVVRSSTELDQLYSRIDEGAKCEQPIKREGLSFSEGDILVGLWSAAYGCSAVHHVQKLERDITNQRIGIQLELSVTGDCPYELMRPFWVVIHEAKGYTINVDISNPQ